MAQKHTHLMKPFRDFLRDREKVLAALVQIDVGIKSGLGISGHLEGIEAIAKGSEKALRIYDGMRALLENALVGKFPTEEELQRPADFDGKGGDELILRMAEWLKFAEHLLDDAKEAGVSLGELGEEEFKKRIGELHIKKATEARNLYQLEQNAYEQMIEREKKK